MIVSCGPFHTWSGETIYLILSSYQTDNASPPFPPLAHVRKNPP